MFGAQHVDCDPGEFLLGFWAKVDRAHGRTQDADRANLEVVSEIIKLFPQGCSNVKLTSAFELTETTATTLDYTRILQPNAESRSDGEPPSPPTLC